MAELRTNPAEQLQVPDEQKLKEELAIQVPSDTAPVDPALKQKAEQVVQTLLAVNPQDVQSQERAKAAVETVGADIQRKASKQSEMLKQPLKILSARAEDGGQVANSLIDLKMQVEDLDPSKLDLSPGWFSRLLGEIPGIGTPLKRYFSRYESAQTVIASIISSLEGGREQLKRDNITLVEDQKRLRELTIKLEQYIKLSQLIDADLTRRIEEEIPSDDPRYKFVNEELLFPLRQRILDLQQQLAVNQQGVLAMEIVIRNNKELIRGVNRALNVTINALQVAVTVAMALANQKIVLDKINAISSTTSNLIAGTAERLRQQGVEIHKEASTSMLEIERLKEAFQNINQAMDEITRFRMEALPKMADQILQMDELTKVASRSIVEKEEGNRLQPIIPIEIE